MEESQWEDGSVLEVLFNSQEVNKGRRLR